MTSQTVPNTHAPQATSHLPSNPNLNDPRTSNYALWGGVLFSLVFTAIIYVAGQRLQAIPHLPDSGASWYY